MGASRDDISIRLGSVISRMSDKGLVACGGQEIGPIGGFDCGLDCAGALCVETPSELCCCVCLAGQEAISRPFVCDRSSRLPIARSK